jgi:hypothetical protein
MLLVNGGSPPTRAKNKPARPPRKGSLPRNEEILQLGGNMDGGGKVLLLLFQSI